MLTVLVLALVPPVVPPVTAPDGPVPDYTIQIEIVYENPVDPYQAFASEHGITIDWRDTDGTDCGVGAVGCYRDDRPSEIQIVTGLGGLYTLGIVQHEVAHALVNRQCGWAATTDEEAVEAYADLVFSGGLTYGNNYEYRETDMKVAQNWKEGGCS